MRTSVFLAVDLGLWRAVFIGKPVMLREANLGDDLSLRRKNVARRRETAFAAAAARTVFLPTKRCILVVGGTRKSVHYKYRAYKNGRSDIFEHFFI